MMDSGCLGGGGGDGGAYVVMEHCHGTYAKTPTKTEVDTSF